MRRLLFLSVTAGPTFAQVPEDTLRNKIYAPKAVKQKFLEENPGAVEESRTEDSVHFRQPDGARWNGSTVVARGIPYDRGTDLLKLRHSRPRGKRLSGPARGAQRAANPGLISKTADRFSRISTSSGRTIP